MSAAILPGILCFLQIVDLMFKVKDKFTNTSDMEKAGVFLRMVGDLLNTVADEIDAGRYPHSKCQEMWHYMEELKTSLGRVLSESHTDFLVQKIQECYRVEQLCGQVNSIEPADKAENIKVLKAAAGSYIACSNLLSLK